MEFRDIMNLIWKWLWLIIIATALATGGAYFISQYTTPVYRATTTLLISEPGASAQTDEFTAILTSERLARSYAERLTNRHVLEDVIATTGLSATPEDLEELIEVQLVRDTQLIELSVEHTSPQVAQLIANEVPKAFATRNQEQQTQRFAASKESLEEELAGIEVEIVAIEQQLAAFDEDNQPPSLETQLIELQAAHSSLLSSYEQVRIAEAQSLSNVIIDEEASLPTEPVRPRTVLNTILSGIVGASVSAGAILLLELLDDTLRDPNEVSIILETPILALIPNLRKADREDLVVVNQPRSPSAESFRTLRTNIQYASVDHPIRTILITSPRESDGKTLVASNLAAVIAQAGRNIVLVDSDLRRPTLTRRFRLQEREGLTDALFLPDFAAMVTWGTSVQKLKLLPSGSVPPNPSELIGSERMLGLLSFMTEHVDVVLLDSPPVLAVTDAVLLSGRVDGVVLVMESGKTRRDEALRAVESLHKANANILGIVLNKVRKTGRGGYYYYYYQSYDEKPDDNNRKTSIMP